MKNNFNIIISGVGGEGLITLLQIVVEAAFIDGYDVKSSELHGLSQRGGSVLTHIRLGEKVYSPLIELGRADLIISLELLEGLRSLNFANKNTHILVNEYFLPILVRLAKDDIIKKLKASSGKNLYIAPAYEICKEKLGQEVVGGIYLLGMAVNKKLVPLNKDSVIRAIKNVIPEKYLELNIKAFELAFSNT